MMLFFLILILLLTGCKKEFQLNNKVLIETLNTLEQEAKLFDVPIPIGAVAYKKGISENSYAFRTSLKIGEIVTFYNNEMEQLGWKKILEFNNSECSLIYSKPNNKKILISIRPEKDSNIVYLFF